MTINLRKRSIGIVLLGVLLLIVSLLVTVIVESNETVKDLEGFLGTTITPDALDSVSDLASMFGYELDGGTKIGISIYKVTPTLSTLGWVAIAAGAILFAADMFISKRT